MHSNYEYFLIVKPHARAAQPAQRRTWMSFLRRNQEEGRLCLADRSCHRDCHQVILSGAKRYRQTSTRQYCYRIWGQFWCRLRHFQFQKEQPSSDGLNNASNSLGFSRIDACQVGQKRQQNGHFPLIRKKPSTKTKQNPTFLLSILAPAGPGFHTVIISCKWFLRFLHALKRETKFVFSFCAWL